MVKLRTCVRCRNKLQQNILLRLQIINGILVKWDGYGRSFYLCEECIINYDCTNSIYKANKIKVGHISNKDVLAAKLKEICGKWQKQK